MNRPITTDDLAGCVAIIVAMAIMGVVGAIILHWIVP